MKQYHAHIVSVGTAVPDRVVTNKDLQQILDTSDEWIFSRTGIRERRIFRKEENAKAFELGGKAATIALQRAKISPDQIDAIVCATFTPDYFFPSTGCLIQNYLKCTNAFAFDVSAACAGFVYGLTVANSLILSGQCQKVLLVGTEIISKTLDWTDRSTAILFGDGAGAMVLSRSEDTERGILSTHCASDGSLSDILYLPAWSGERQVMHMKGNEVFKNAVRFMSEASKKAIAQAKLELSDIDYMVPHQANIRIISAVGEHLGIAPDKVIVNVNRYGNTSSASIPLAFEEIWLAGKVTPGTNVLFTSLGGGIAIGSAVVRF